ncbi:MAG: antitoxin MazE family protein [Acidobacteriota bacterium]|nr:antitoxin MazE family protein [Acidobacteriota bacterium]
MKSTPNKPSEPRRPESASRVRRHRETLRARGLKPVTHWVPDVRRAELLEEYQRQLGVLSARNESSEITDWMDKVRCTEGWV